MFQKSVLKTHKYTDCCDFNYPKTLQHDFVLVTGIVLNFGRLKNEFRNFNRVMSKTSKGDPFSLCFILYVHKFFSEVCFMTMQCILGPIVQIINETLTF